MVRGPLRIVLWILGAVGMLWLILWLIALPGMGGMMGEGGMMGAGMMDRGRMDGGMMGGGMMVVMVGGMALQLVGMLGLAGIFVYLVIDGLRGRSSAHGVEGGSGA